jgi:hypothetical protein
MATQWQTFPVEFKGGLMSNLSPLQHGTNAIGSATILQNFEANKEGGYSKIRGFEKYSTTEVPGSGSILSVKVISSGRIVVARKNANNFTQYYYGTGTNWNSMATSAATNGGKARHVLYNLEGTDKVVFVDGTNFPAIYNTSGNTLTFMTSSNSTDVLGAEHVAIFKNHAFYAKGNTVFFTSPFTVDDFDTGLGAGSINVASNITGLAVFRDQLIIFTEDSIKRLTGSSIADWNLSPITDRIGCINGDTIQEVGGDIMYLAPDGIRLLSATDRIGDFGLDIASDVIAKDATTFLSQTSTFCSVVLKEKAQYRIFAYVTSEQEEAAKGLIATKFTSQGAEGMAWSTTKGIKAFVADSRYNTTQETLAFANEDGYIYVMESGASFNGLPIEAIYESPYMPITDPQVRKTFYKVTLYAEPTGNMDLALNLKYDFSTGSSNQVLQPATQSVASTGSSVFIFGASNSKFASSNRIADNSLLTSPNGPWLSYPDQAGPFYNEDNELFTPSTFGGELDKVYPTNVVGSGKTVALRFEDFSTNPTFTLDTALFEYSQEDRQ